MFIPSFSKLSFLKILKSMVFIILVILTQLLRFILSVFTKSFCRPAVYTNLEKSSDMLVNSLFT